jgi:ABC-type transporter Mla MlaB component
MLRITRLADVEPQQTLRLEGKLTGPWVAELERVCVQQLEPMSRVRLDLSAVSFVDAAGVNLLRDLLGRGVTVGACSGLIAKLLHLESR